MKAPKDLEEYSRVRKLILKNLILHYYRVDVENMDIIPVQLAEHIPYLEQQINIRPQLTEQLEAYYRRKFDEEKETESTSPARNVGTKADDSNQIK